MSKSIKVVFIKQNARANEGTVFVRTIENSVLLRTFQERERCENHFSK